MGLKKFAAGLALSASMLLCGGAYAADLEVTH